MSRPGSKTLYSLVLQTNVLLIHIMLIKTSRP
uniref:Uncharacterized protein n=1 Tax=Anguilla anguilla TaxID=7936 RepID=A0A0E9PDV9_ANGAN